MSIARWGVWIANESVKLMQRKDKERLDYVMPANNVVTPDYERCCHGDDTAGMTLTPTVAWVQIKEERGDVSSRLYETIIEI